VKLTPGGRKLQLIYPDDTKSFYFPIEKKIFRVSINKKKGYAPPGPNLSIFFIN